MFATRRIATLTTSIIVALGATGAQAAADVGIFATQADRPEDPTLLTSVGLEPDSTAIPAKLERRYEATLKRFERVTDEQGRDIVDRGIREDGEVRAATQEEVRADQRRLERETDRARKKAEASQEGSTGGDVLGVSRGVLDKIATCESHGDPKAIGGGGAYRGKYQFDRGTWAGVGGSGDPAAAPEREQDKRAAMLIKRNGTGQWPVCG